MIERPLVCDGTHGNILIYHYLIQPSHSRRDTDSFILHSVRRFRLDRGLPATEFDVRRDEYGKPFVTTGKEHLSVTHTAGSLWIAVSPNPVGIDCESTARRIDQPERIAARFFSTSEFECFKACPLEPDRSFLDRWVRKEAYVKLTGKGLAGLRSADTVALEERGIVKFLPLQLGDCLVASLCEYVALSSDRGDDDPQ